MSELNNYINQVFINKPFRLIVSNPRNRSDSFSKATIEDKGDYFQLEKQIGKQVFHENLTTDQLKLELDKLLSESFRQLNAFDDNTEYNLRISKKEKVFLGRSKNTQVKRPEISHNRQKQYIL